MKEKTTRVELWETKRNEIKKEMKDLTDYIRELEEENARLYVRNVELELDNDILAIKLRMADGKR